MHITVIFLLAFCLLLYLSLVVAGSARTELFLDPSYEGHYFNIKHSNDENVNWEYINIPYEREGCQSFIKQFNL